MTTNKELQEWLKRFPDDALIEVVEVKTKGYESFGEEVPIELDTYVGNVTAYDFTAIGKPFVIVLGEK